MAIVMELSNVPKGIRLNFWYLFNGGLSLHFDHSVYDLTSAPVSIAVKQYGQTLLTMTTGSGLVSTAVPAAQVPNRPPTSWANNWQRLEIIPTQSQLDTMRGKKNLTGDLVFTVSGQPYQPCYLVFVVQEGAP